MRSPSLPKITREWTRRGDTEYRIMDAADIVGTVVSNADFDSLYLTFPDGPLRTFVVALNGQDEPIAEYRKGNA